MLTCPLCQKEIDPPAPVCPRCRADLSLLADHMNDATAAYERAERLRLAGDLAGAVEAYVAVIEIDPMHERTWETLGPALRAVRVDSFMRRGPERFAARASLVLMSVLALALGFFVGIGFNPFFRSQP